MVQLLQCILSAILGALQSPLPPRASPWTNLVLRAARRERWQGRPAARTQILRTARKARKQEALCQSLSGMTASPLGGTALPGSMFKAYLQKGPLSQGNPNSLRSSGQKASSWPCFRASHVTHFPSVPSPCGSPFHYASIMQKGASWLYSLPISGQVLSVPGHGFSPIEWTY